MDAFVDGVRQGEWDGASGSPRAAKFRMPPLYSA